MDIVERLRAWANSIFPPTFDDLHEAADEIERLREALKFYGSPSNWLHSSDDYMEPSLIERDGGKIARVALKEDE